MIRNYDAIGRLSGVQNNTTSANYVSSIAYNAANEVTGFTYGNSVTASFGYSAERLQLTSLSYTQNSQTIFSLSYGYTQNNGNNGQKTQITDNVQSGRTLTYTYDSLKRLKTAVTNGSTPYPQWGLSWTYDRYGNRTQQSVTHGSGPSNSVTVSSSTNQITEMASTTFQYDSNGNLTQDDLYKYKYDAENRLMELRLANDTLVATYTMDGHGLRVLKSVSGLRTWSIYDGTKLISEFEDSSTATYTSGTTPGAAPSDGDSTLLYQHADHLTTRFTTDNSGMSGNLQAHYPYGETWYNIGDADPSVVRKFSSLRMESEATTGKLFSSPKAVYSARTGRALTPSVNPSNNGSPQSLNTLGSSASAFIFCPSGWDPTVPCTDDSNRNRCGIYISPFMSPIPKGGDVNCDIPGPMIPFRPEGHWLWPVSTAHTSCTQKSEFPFAPHEISGVRFCTYALGTCDRVLRCSGQIILGNVPWTGIVERHKAQYGVDPVACPMTVIARYKVIQINTLFFTQCWYSFERATFVSKASPWQI